MAKTGPCKTDLLRWWVPGMKCKKCGSKALTCRIFNYRRDRVMVSCMDCHMNPEWVPYYGRV